MLSWPTGVWAMSKSREPVETRLTGGRDRTTPEANRLHIGAGDENPADAVTIDKVDWGHTDYVHDIRERWPFADGVFTEIVANHVLEHLGDPVPVFREAARTLQDGGRFIVRVPVGVDAIADPTHESRWTWRSPEFYSTAAEPWQPGAVAGLPFTVADRELSMWTHWGGTLSAAVIDWYADQDPVVAQDIPGCSGELTAVFRRVER